MPGGWAPTVVPAGQREAVRRFDPSELVDPVDLPTVLGLIAAVSGHSTDEIAVDAAFTDDLGFDSIMVMQLADRIAAQWEFEVPVQDFVTAVVTVGDLVEFLREKVPPVELRP
nr:acyl carrier protein [Micromonospora sp. DSM 115978]